MTVIKDMRKGRFNLPLDMINDSPEEVQALMSKVIVLMAEVDPPTEGIQYVAIGDLFRQLKPEEAVPSYSVEKKQSISGKTTVTKLVLSELSPKSKLEVV